MGNLRELAAGLNDDLFGTNEEGENNTIDTFGSVFGGAVESGGSVAQIF